MDGQEALIAVVVIALVVALLLAWLLGQRRTMTDLRDALGEQHRHFTKTHGGASNTTAKPAGAASRAPAETHAIEE